MQTNFALFATFWGNITKFRVKRNFIRTSSKSLLFEKPIAILPIAIAIFEMPIVSIKTKIRNGRANIQVKFRRDIAKFLRGIANAKH